MKRVVCFIAAPDYAAAKNAAMSAANPYFERVGNSWGTQEVIMSEDSLAAVRAAGINVVVQGPA